MIPRFHHRALVVLARSQARSRTEEDNISSGRKLHQAENVALESGVFMLWRKLLLFADALKLGFIRSSLTLVAMQCCCYLNGAAALFPRSTALLHSPGNSCASLPPQRLRALPFLLTSSFNRFQSFASSADLLDNAQESGSEVQGIPYMGDVDSFEEREAPAKYVPPPQIDAAALDMRDKVERLLYMLQEILPGPASEEKHEAIFELIDEDVEFQDPLLCFRGCQGLKSMLQAFGAGGANLDLHEIYYESLATDPLKRWIYATWTITFTRNETALSMSGESKLEMNQSGKVMCIVSKWYQLNDAAEDDLIASKLGISAMLSKQFVDYRRQ